MSTSLSLRELQKICSDNRALLPKGFRCGGKGINRGLLLEQLNIIGLLPGEGTVSRETVHAPNVSFESSMDIETGLDWSTMKKHKLLGKGFFGSVYDVEYSNQHFALKHMYGSRDIHFRAFVLESSILSRLNHPNIVKIVGLGVTIAMSIILMPLYDNNLESLLKYKQLSSDEILRYTHNIVAAVAYIHSRDIAHLDIKPENFLYDVKTDTVLLADFGVSRSFVCQNSDLSVMSIVHAPPEQLFDISSPKGLEVDTWGVGIILLQLSGEPINISSTDDEFTDDIQKLLGPIPAMLWPNVTIDRKVKQNQQLDVIRKKIGNEALFQLALSMLAYDPTKRVRMQAALRDPVFEDIREQEDVTTITCLDNLYLRRLLRSDSPFPINDIKPDDVDDVWNWLILVTSHEINFDELYLTRHIIDEGVQDDLSAAILPLYACACWYLASLSYGSYGGTIHLNYLIYQRKKKEKPKFTEEELQAEVANVAAAVACDLVLATAHNFIVRYSTEYPENERVKLAALAQLIGLYYLFCDSYYTVEAYEIAASAIFHASRALGIPYRLEGVLAVKNIKVPNTDRTSVNALIRAQFPQEAESIIV